MRGTLWFGYSTVQLKLEIFSRDPQLVSCDPSTVQLVQLNEVKRYWNIKTKNVKKFPPSLKYRC